MELLRSLTPAQYCQAFYVAIGGGIAALHFCPPELQKAFIGYGFRSTGDGKAAPSKLEWVELVQKISNAIQVSHSWFTHFYAVSLLWSLFWWGQFLSEGPIMHWLAERQRASGTDNVDMGRVVIAMTLMALQGARRLYESLFVSKQGKTPMMFAAWVAGLLYYAANGVAVWIEGADAVSRGWTSAQEISILTPRNVFGIAVFLYAAATQYRCHRHLASLKKYSLPTEGWFASVLCAHYTAECLLYLALAFVAAPPDRLFNTTLLCSVFFAASNLGVTALDAKQWYVNKFGADQVEHKWCMIPYVF
ncbi:Polyprenol reductase [Escovopsis weberi]|uniref:Polyprenal reductase n=1 Tax=Escovopsis weberi TaxID=150374 RepID=A0A0N0RT12_ESCWE|nr:Polyprenol reductase [Escovopsis weberi]